MDGSIKFLITRALVYAASTFAALGAGTLAARGWASYDAATGLLDFHPIDVRAVVSGFAVWIAGGGLAFVAVIKGWGGGTAAPK